MVTLYAAADLFVLPSLRDPSPLSAVEALAAGLPLLLSDKAGNVDEVLTPGNGWRFSPERPIEMRSLLKSILRLTRSELAAMGEVSRSKYVDEFDSDAWVHCLGDALSAMVK